MKLSIRSLEKLYDELGDYGKSLGSFDEVSEDIFNVLSLDDENLKVDHNPWVQKLVDINRFPGINKVISDNVFSHQVRLSNMIKENIHFLIILNKNLEEFGLEKEIDIKYLISLALVHDDVEGINPLLDIPTDIKMRLSNEANNTLSYIENKCMDILCIHQADHLKITSSSELKKLYLDAENKESLEGQFVSYLDKVDGFCYCIHELVNGNRDFKEPFNTYINIFKDIKSNKGKYSKIRFLIDSNNFNLIDFFEDKFGDKAIDYVGRPLFPGEKMNYDRLIRVYHALDFFNIDQILEMEGRENELLTGEYLIDKKNEYSDLYFNEEIGITKNYLNPEVRTSPYYFYEEWKISFAKTYYDQGEGVYVNGYDQMYKKEAV